MERIKVGKYLDKYLDICENQKGLSPNTLNGYRVNIRHIKSVIGDYYLEDITADLLDELFLNLSLKGLSGTSQLYIYRVLHSAFELGVKRREIQFNYCDMIEPPKKDKFKPTIILNENLFDFFEILNSYNIKYSLPIMLSLNLGLRRGEVLGLKWSDIDFENKILHIQRTATPHKNGYIFTDCKTDKSNRLLQLSDYLISKLLEWQKIQNTFNLVNGIEFVFTQENGKVYSATTLNKKYKEILKKCDLDTNIRFHDLRHTFASYLISENVSIPIVSQMLGHSKVSTTLDIYTHSDIKQQKIAIDKFEKIVDFTE